MTDKEVNELVTKGRGGVTEKQARIILKDREERAEKAAEEAKKAEAEAKKAEAKKAEQETKTKGK